MRTIDSLFEKKEAPIFTSEAKFTTWFLESFWKKDTKFSHSWTVLKDSPTTWFIYKISDDSRWYKPFDCFWVIWGIGVAIEIKITDAIKTKPYRLLSGYKKPWTQIASLWLRQHNWWLSIVVVYSKKTQKYCWYHFKWMDENTLISLD